MVSGRRILADLGLLLVVVGTLLAVYAIVQILGESPLLDVLVVGSLLAVPAIGLVKWRSGGHGWWAVLSWTVPLAIALLAVRLFNPLPIVGALYVVVLASAGLLMSGVPEAADWWYRRILRTSPPT